jgi:ATP-dependent DNA helicase RecG
LPEAWTAQYLLGKHSSQPFNPSIAHVFYLAGFIESWGRGIETICRACEMDGIPAPEYIVHPHDIMVKFTSPEDRIIRRDAPQGAAERVIDKVTEKVTDRVTEKELVVLKVIAGNPHITIAELVNTLSVSRKTVSKHIKTLKAKGIIKRVGSDRKGFWEVT